MFDLTKKIQEINLVLQDVQKRSEPIPFGNSAFQNINFIKNIKMSDTRAYRDMLLRVNDRIRACKEAIYSIRKEDIDILELREKIANEETSKFDKMRAEIDLEQKLENRAYTEKLFKDAEEEIKTLYCEIRKMPEFSREQFEAGEREYFELSLTKQALGLTGANESLLSMDYDFNKIKSGEAEKFIIAKNKEIRQELIGND